MGNEDQFLEGLDIVAQQQLCTNIAYCHQNLVYLDGICNATVKLPIFVLDCVMLFESSVALIAVAVVMAYRSALFSNSSLLVVKPAY